MFNPKRKQSSRFCPWDRPELRWGIPVFCFLIMLAGAAAQDAGTNAGTNQPVRQTGSTNTTPIATDEIPALSPAVTNQLGAETGSTNEFGQPLNPPPQVGPVAIGAAQPTAPLMGTSVFGSTTGGAAPVLTGAGIPLWGPIDIRPHMLYSLVYGNGIEAQPGQSSKTVVHTVAPGFLLDIGEHWSIDYTPTLSFYSNPAFKDTVDQSVLLRGSTSSDNWNLNLSQGYALSTQPLIETGTQTAQEGYTTAISAAHPISDNMSVQFGVNQNIRLAQGFTDLHEWTTTESFNYQFVPQLSAGLGLVLGYDAVSPGSDMPSEQINGTISFHPGPRLTLSVSGGVEDRQFVGPSAPPLISPVFSGSIKYQIFQPTVLTIAASRTVTPSYFANQVEVITMFSGGLHQQISPKLSLDLSGSYGTTPTTSIEAAPLPQFFIGAPPVTALSVVRDDTTTSARINLSYLLTQRATLSIFYTISQNASGQANFGYSSSQVGLSLNYRY